jgi:hypothetical protein
LPTVLRLAAFAVTVLAALSLVVCALPFDALALHALPLHSLPCGPNAFAIAHALLLLLQGTLTELPLLLSLLLRRPVGVGVVVFVVVVVHVQGLGQVCGEVGACLRRRPVGDRSTGELV